MQLAIAHALAIPAWLVNGLHHVQQGLVRRVSDIAFHHGDMRKHLDGGPLAVHERAGNRLRSRAWRLEHAVQVGLILTAQIQFMAKISELLKIDRLAVSVFHLVAAFGAVDQPVTQAPCTQDCRVGIEAASVARSEVLQGCLKQSLLERSRVPGAVVAPGHQLKGFNVEVELETFDKRFRQQGGCKLLRR